jgi:type IV pilus assembly protein PilA
MSTYPPPQPRTTLALWSLILGILSLLTGGCLGIGAIVAIVLGVMAMSRAGKLPAEYGGKGMAIGGIVTGALGLVMLPVIGIIAAIAIPGLLRARVSANEAMAIGDIRAVISSEMAYSAYNNGNYDTIECLQAPNSCLPEYTGVPMLSGEFSMIKGGYRRTFYPGPRAASGDKTSPSSATGFAITAVPLQRNRTGVRGFCGDHTGVICQTMDGSEPPVVDGACGQPCSPIY